MLKEMAQSSTALPKKNINDLNVELGHPLQSITCATAKALGLQVADIFEFCLDCALGKAKHCRVSKKVVAQLKILGERLFLCIHLTHTFGGKKYWLIIIENSSDYSWSFFLKDKSN